MAQPSTITDPASGEVVKFGSQKCTFATAGALIAEEIDYKKPMTTHLVRDENGKCYKAIHVAEELGKGTMTVQVKAAGTKITIGDSTTFLDTDGTVSYPVYVTELGVKYSNGDVTKIPISISEKIN